MTLLLFTRQMRATSALQGALCFLTLPMNGFILLKSKPKPPLDGFFSIHNTSHVIFENVHFRNTHVGITLENVGHAELGLTLENVEIGVHVPKDSWVGKMDTKIVQKKHSS
jgi:hypothetical protein